MDYKILGKRLKREREMRELTQEQLAEILGISQKMLSLIENGRRRATIDLIIKFSDVFVITLDELIKGEYIKGNNVLDMACLKLKTLQPMEQDYILKMIEGFVELNESRVYKESTRQYVSCRKLKSLVK